MKPHHFCLKALTMDEFPCAVCSKDCHSDTIQCSNCNNWVHRTCYDMTENCFNSWSPSHLKFLCKCCTFAGNSYDASAALAR